MTKVAVVSFNQNERAAVDELLDRISAESSRWKRAGPNGLRRTYGTDEWRIDHVPLNAQGNVVASAALVSQFFNNRYPPDYVVFYGCAGTPRAADVGGVFLVQGVTYLSLGTVQPAARNSERVTLKNKWIADLYPASDVTRLNPYTFLLASPGQAARLPEGLIDAVSAAWVAATDKVIHVQPSSPAPRPMTMPPGGYFKKAEWTYAEAIAYLQNSSSICLLVEMESYGIAAVAASMDLLNRIVVLRIATDSLGAKTQPSNDDQQAGLLQDGIEILGRVIAILLNARYEE